LAAQLAIIQLHPKNAPHGVDEKWTFLCFNFALCYLTGQQIGRDRDGCSFNPEDHKLWKSWWTKVGKTFKVPREKPKASWVPAYQVH